MDFSVKSKFNENENQWDVRVLGEIDVFNSEEFKKTLMSLIEEKKINISLECEELTYIDSTGLGSMVGVLKNVRQYDGDIIIKNLKPSLLKLFKITSLDRAFKIEVSDNE